MDMIDKSTLGISVSNFGTAPNGTSVNLYTLANSRGTVVKITNFGGIITEIHVPDKNGLLSDIALGFDHIEPYHK
ncbi:MAG: galactose-1-epimerase, partial [Moraxellaceae bacterium]